MIKDFSLQEAIHQIGECHDSMKEVFPFMKKNQLWKGFRENKWILLTTIILSILITYILINNFLGGTPIDSNEFNLDLGDEIDDAKIEKIKAIGASALMTGGWKNLFLILSEVVIFYFATKALATLKGIKINPTFKHFVKAQKRMIAVMIRSFIIAILISIPINIVFGILGLNDFVDFAMFFVYAYFIGLAFLDNYNEQYELPIRESGKHIYQHRYASIFLGVVISLMLYVPLIGTLITPLFGAITATIYGHKNNMELFEEEDIF